ncbi:MAG: bifunctional (p)ppGpp synthetase/guanosine-3',5'-bis(diphosphate) 3'-pyrophosphohydrolase [Deltaproteobacteria bacterium]|nr:bifunctional (p)ppGpp synthetase/guanosine-3',5'-bis(diphosphate) 3'-pyrophosphohydrolase [Deltaproteobacteria bacterium]
MNLSGLLDKVREYNPAADLATVQRAYEFSAEVHRGQKRKSGEPYLVHPLEVASLIADLRLDVPSVATGLLHDTVEDTLTTLGQVENVFGSEIAGLVDGVSKIGQINFKSRAESQAENFRKMIIAMARDIRVLLIKLADRTHNMRTLSHLPLERQTEIAQETLDIYAPLAHRLGIYWIKSELEDSALRYMHPEIYYQLKRNVAKKKAEREQYIEHVRGVLLKKLDAAGIEATVTGRPKHFYSIYQKMQTQHLLYDQIYDLVAFRLLVDSTRECYEALGVAHQNWKPVPGRFRDYIAMPKANMYQSLHTTVIGPFGERMEVQIRTHEMHRVAEAGIAAHWRYKGQSQSDSPQEIERFAWLRQMLHWQQHLEDPQEFMRSVKEDLFEEEVFAFTPRGDLFNFPAGATVIDFAYRVHSQVGEHCAGARVNGKLVPLKYQLQSGDTIEIITTTRQTPSKDWLKIVTTTRAKERIRNWIKAQQRRRSLEIGTELLDRDLRRYRRDLAKLRKSGDLDRVAHELGFKDEESLVAAVGYGRLPSQHVLVRLVPDSTNEERKERSEGTLQKLLRMVGRQGKGGVQVSGIDDVMVRFGRCCNPLPGERITGFITRGRGVTVHAIDCLRVMESDPQRRVEVAWDGAAGHFRPVQVEVTAVDAPGLLAAMSKAISTAGVNISRAEVRTGIDKKAVNVFELMVDSVDGLNRVMRGLGKVKGVMKVQRVRA